MEGDDSEAAEPNTIVTSDAAQKAVELLKQKVMGEKGASASSSTLSPDPCTVDWKGKIPFPDFSKVGVGSTSTSAAPDTQLTSMLSERIHNWLRSVPVESVSERIREALSSIPTPDSEFVWFLLGGAFAIALANILFSDDSTSSSDKDDDKDAKNRGAVAEEGDAVAQDKDIDAKYGGAVAEEDDVAEDVNAKNGRDGGSGDEEGDAVTEEDENEDVDAKDGGAVAED